MSISVRSVPFNRVSQTSAQGLVEVDFNTLVAVFGEPKFVSNDRVTHEWWVELRCNRWNEVHVATIYDWRQAPVPANQMAVWSVGGFSQHSVYLVKAAIAAYQAKRDGFVAV